ncbi:putative DNA-directed DNA polymerase [Pseudomonas phage Ep4]|uniref:DNA-directed DNA polymerase n=1 Tax=Pseudomonas phage Ep4 TaxID=3057492 RepID=A0AAU9EST2_9CAUD|nr:putative DNA-directed DNA polymerase [Pseudomonas phage Ep4]
MYKILFVDIETENKPWYGQVASPFNPENYIVAPGWRVDTVQDDGYIVVGTTEYRYFNSAEEADAGADWFNVLDECAIMVCHNSMFEQKWFLSKYRTVLENFLKRGGRIACTALGHYLVSHQQDLYPSLDETAPLYGGCHKVDGVKILWQQGKLTSEIDKDLLIEYLAGPSGDIDNTAMCYYGEMQKLAEQDMVTMFWERCEAQLAFGYCEWFGLHVNGDVAFKNLAEQEAEIARLTKELHNLLPADLPDWVAFNFGSDYHMSALIYGGPVRGRRRVPYDPPQYEKADYVKTTDGASFLGEDAQHYVTLDAGADWVRYKSGKNKGQVKVFREDTDEEKLKWAEDAFPLPGLVNLQTLPDVVRDKYLGRRAEYRGARMLCDGTTPVYSTSTEALQGLKNFVPAVGLMVSLASLEKDTGSFYLRKEYNADGSLKKKSGMLQFVGPDSIIHHSLNCTATVTGRLSCSKPNLQQLPRDGTSRVKEMFTSRWGELGRIIEVDYSALEVVMLAAMTGDTDLLELLLDGTDMHCYRLAFKLGEPYEDVLRKAVQVHDERHPDHDPANTEYKRYKQMRTDIKPLSFADQYGASAAGIAFSTGCTVEFAQEFQDNEARLFPISRGYREVIAKEVQSTGGLPSGIHREMHDNGSWSVYRRGYFQGPSGTCYSFRQHPTWDKESRSEIMAFKPTQMANYPFQGEAGFMMSSAMGRICRWLIGKNWFDGQVALINNVHDCCYADAANATVGRSAALGIKAIMEDMPKYLAGMFPRFAIAHVPFPAQAEMGPSMFDHTHVH